MKSIVWTIAGSDSGGGAGIQADLHTFHNFNVHGCSVITAITAQNSVNVNDVDFLSPKIIRSQFEALNSDLPAKAIKLGMLGNVNVIQTVAEFLQSYKGFVICDPVMIATTGGTLTEPKAKEALIELILPYVDLITPNLFEAKQITQKALNTFEEIEQAANEILKLGPKSVLIKGGHSENTICQDYWTDGHESFWLSHQKIENHNTHGSGCTLSAAMTANIALGNELQEALVISKHYVTQGIYHADSLGKGPGPISHHHSDKIPIDFQTLSKQPNPFPSTFPNCGDAPLGLYPIVDSFDWIKKLLPLGITTIQLRIKDKTGELLENEIKESIALARHYQVRLFINDYWELAIKHGAYGVHLGQEDLDSADILKIYEARLRLGISTHCHYEVARAHYFKPSYIAIGPIFPTTSKVMKFSPQGIEKLKYWQRRLKYPLVAIGGIGTKEFDAVRKTSVSGIAMISAITQANDPVTVLKEFNDMALFFEK